MITRFLLIACAASLLTAAEFRTERVFGPEVPTGPYKHPACYEAFDNGDLYSCYYGGDGEYARYGVYGSRLQEGRDGLVRAETGNRA